MKAHSVFSLVLLCGALTHPVQADLVGHWKFDEGSGTTFADSSDNGNDAYPPGSRVWSTDVPPTGIDNTSSLEFDGVGIYVDTPFEGIGGDAARTVAFWVKSTAANTHGIVAWGLSSANGQKWHVRINNNAGNGPAGAIRTESQGDFTIGSTPIDDGTWHHVASVYPGGGELGTVLHYIDGVLETAGGNNASTQPVNTSTTADPVTIGRRTQGAAQNYFPGSVDDVRIYDRALSEQEVNDLMGDTPPTDGLVFYMPFEEGSGDTVDDLGSGDNDGTITGVGGVFPTWSTDAPPHLSNSLLFANAGDLLFTDFPGIGGTASRSLTFWFKTTLAGDNGILAWGDSGGNGLKWHARINTSAGDGPVGALRLEIQGGRTVATTPVNDGEWHHAAIVFEEDADPDIEDVVFYLDGELDPVDMLTSVPIDTQIGGPGDFPFTIGGRDQTGTIRGYDGNLADVRVYDTGLSQEEVQSIMAGQGLGQKLQLDVSQAGGMLSIAWESQPGMLYSLRSETDPSAATPSEWPIFDPDLDGSFEGIEGTPPQNMVSFSLPTESERFFVVEEFPPPPVVVFAEDFEDGQGSWTTGSDGDAGTEWQLGEPSVIGPLAANSPTNAFGTNIDAAYTTGTNTWLRSPPIDLTNASGATLNYFRFIDIEPDFDSGTVSVLDAADNSELATIETGIDGLSADWEAVRRSIPEVALGKSVIIEFRLETDDFDVVDYAGFYVDDIEVTVP